MIFEGTGENETEITLDIKAIKALQLCTGTVWTGTHRGSCPFSRKQQ